MFRKLKDIPDCLGNIDGVDYEADIDVKISSDKRIQQEILDCDDMNISLDKHYHIHKITSYGDPFDVWIINDNGEEEQLGEWFFEDID